MHTKLDTKYLVVHTKLNTKYLVVHTKLDIKFLLRLIPISGGVFISVFNLVSYSFVVSFWWLSWSHHCECFSVAIMTSLTVTEYPCHKRPRICSVCRNHNPVLSSIITYHLVCNKNNTTGATTGKGTVYPSGAPEFTPGFKWGSCLLNSRSLFVLLSFLTVLYVLRYTASIIRLISSFKLSKIWIYHLILFPVLFVSINQYTFNNQSSNQSIIFSCGWW